MLGQNGSVSDGREEHAGCGNGVLRLSVPSEVTARCARSALVAPENVTAAGGPAEALSTEGCW